MTPRFTITNTIATHLTTIERACGFLDAAALGEKWVNRMANRALLLEAHHTTHIEGTQLTLEQAERLLNGEPVPEADPDDARELLNYRDAFTFVSEYFGDGGPITEGLIREIHRLLVKGVRGGQGQPGAYRHVQNLVVNSATGETVYTPPPPGDVPAQMQELVAWLNAPTDIHAVLVSGIAQFQLVHIHPFVDGNGRTSRLLSTLCLYRSGYDFKRLFTLSEFYDRDRPAFYAAIQGVRDNGMELTGWLEYFVTGLATQMHETQEHGRRVIKADLIAREHALNDRQQELLIYCMETGESTATDLYAAFDEIARRTLQRDLQTLVDKGLLTALGHTNARRYSLTESVL
jgi:Fic family protein